MKHINKFDTTEEYTQAIGGGGQLADLEHFIAYTKDTDKIYLKQPPKPQTKTMKFVFGENEINTINQVKEMEMPLPSWVLIGRKDLFKSIKYQGNELLKEPTVDPIDWNSITSGETKEDMKQPYLLSKILNQETMDWNSDYVLTIQDVLGKELPEVGDEILLEVEFKDGLTDLSAMHTALSVGLVEISSNLFEDCTEVTNFAYAFDNSMLSMMGVTYVNPLKSSCPVDKDGTPLYERSNGKEGYATVTISEGCFGNCVNMSDYEIIPKKWKIIEYKIIINSVFKGSNNASFIEILDNGETIKHEILTEEYKIEDAPYGFKLYTDLGPSGTYGSSIRKIKFTNYSTAKVTDMSDMFSNCNNLMALDLSSFDTSNVTNMNCMFNHCSNLDSLNLSSFNTSNVTDMNRMFSNCRRLPKLDLSSFNISNVTDLCFMFIGCESLTSLDLSNFDASNVTIMTRMFENCYNLTCIKCKQSFKDWCIEHQDNIVLPTTMSEGTVGGIGSGANWEIIDYVEQE